MRTLAVPIVLLLSHCCGTLGQLSSADFRRIGTEIEIANYTFTENISQCKTEDWLISGYCAGNARGCLISEIKSLQNLCVCKAGYSGYTDFVDLSVSHSWEMSVGANCHIRRDIRIWCVAIYGVTGLCVLLLNLKRNWPEYKCVARFGCSKLCDKKGTPAQRANFNKLMLNAIIFSECFAVVITCSVAIFGGQLFGHDIVVSFGLGVCHLLFFWCCYRAVWMFIKFVLKTAKAFNDKHLYLLQLLSRRVFGPMLCLSVVLSTACWVVMCFDVAKPTKETLLVVSNFGVLGMGWSSLLCGIFFIYKLNAQVLSTHKISEQAMANSVSSMEAMRKNNDKLLLVVKQSVKLVVGITCVSTLMSIGMVVLTLIWGFRIYEAYLFPLILGPGARGISIILMNYFSLAEDIKRARGARVNPATQSVATELSSDICRTQVGSSAGSGLSSGARINSSVSGESSAFAVSTANCDSETSTQHSETTLQSVKESSALTSTTN